MHHLETPPKTTTGGNLTDKQQIVMGLAIVLTIVLIGWIVHAVRNHKSGEGFASEGGPAGRVLLGGSVVSHDMNAVAIEKNPCGAAECSLGLGAEIACSEGPCAALRSQERFGTKPEQFEPQSWDERSNFTPNPHPKKVSLLGHDLMGVPRKFDLSD